MAYHNNTFSSNTNDTYLESEVLGADPVKLVHLLYRGAIDAVGAARRHLSAGEIPQRSRKITKAWEILNELLTSLNKDAAGEQSAEAEALTRQLAELYAFMQQRLLDANAEQADEPLAEVESLLDTLCEAWSELAQQSRPAAAQNMTTASASSSSQTQAAEPGLSAGYRPLRAAY